MRRTLAAWAVSLSFLVPAGTALAVPFQVGDGGAIVVDTTGGQNYGYPLQVSSQGQFAYIHQAIAHPQFSLGIGDSMVLDLFRVEVRGLATGAITATVQFLQPNVEADPSVAGTIAPGTFSTDSGTKHIVMNGQYGLLGEDLFGAASITWDGPVVVGNGNGGLLGLSLADVQSSGTDTFLVSGTGTNLVTPVPEPASLLLLGTGLLGIAAGRRKADG